MVRRNDMKLACIWRCLGTLGAVSAISLGVVVLCHPPATGIATRPLLDRIQTTFVREDLSPDERASFERFRDLIITNVRTLHRSAAYSYWSAGIGLPVLGLYVLVNLRKLIKRSGEPAAAPNGGPATPVGNSGVAGGPPSVS